MFIPPHGQRVGLVADFLPHIPVPFKGWVHVESDQPIVGLASLSRSSEEGITCFSLTPNKGQTQIHWGLLRSGQGWWTGLALACGGEGISLGWTAWDGLGSISGCNAPLQIPSLGSAAGFARDWFPGRNEAGENLGAIVSSSRGRVFPLVVEGRRTSEGLGQGVMAWVPCTPPSTRLVLPHFRCGEEWYTRLLLGNAGTSSEATLQAQLFDSEGNPVARAQWIMQPGDLVQLYVLDLIHLGTKQIPNQRDRASVEIRNTGNAPTE